MKRNYLEALRQLLLQYQLDQTEISDILQDYEDMYDNWISTGMTDEEVEDKLGHPNTIIKDLTDGVRRKPKKQGKGEKVIAVMPFISLIIFMLLGFAGDLWQYSWMAFLLIPITAIVVKQGFRKNGHFFTAISPFVATVTFLILGFALDAWHPAWMIFLIIPVSGILQSKKSMGLLQLLISLSPFVSIVVFFILGEAGYWQQAWLVFLSIPMLGALGESNKGKVFMIEGLIILGIIGYLYVGYTYEEWTYALFSFTPAVIYLVLIGNIEVGILKAPRDYKIVIVSAAIIFLTIGLTVGYWHLAWLIFLSIPVYSILKETKGKAKIISLTPFIAMVIFFTVGFLFDGFMYAWIAFLIIPITGILLSD